MSRCILSFRTAAFVGLLILTCLAVAAKAQPVQYWPGGDTRALDVDPWKIDCIIDPAVRYIVATASSEEVSGTDFLIVGINIEDSVCTQLPFDLIVTGYPGDPPPGIESYVPGPCWWEGYPIHMCDEGLSNIVTASPQNPISGVGRWRVFTIPLYPDSLPQSSDVNIEFYFIFESDKNRVKILDSVNGLMSGTISLVPGELGKAQQDTVFYFEVPWEAHPLEPHKMHFPQYPDVYGMDVNCTFPLVIADDWMCTKSGPADQIRFWFSARGDWFDPYGFLPDQISSIHVSVHSNIPDYDYEGPLYSMPDSVLWEADFMPDAPEVTITEYDFGPQAWYDPYTGEFIPDDHFNIYECALENIEYPFLQEEGNVYWLDISISTPFPEPELAFGWKTSDRLRYPADYRGEHYMDDAVWADIMFPDWINMTYPAGPDSGESLDLAFMVGTMPEVCGNGTWGPAEWCGQDCYTVTTSADMTHDCIVNLMDHYLFTRDYLKMGPGISGDFNGSGICDIVDFAIFVTKFMTTVTPCIPADFVVVGGPAGHLHLSFSSDPSTLVTYLIAPPVGPVRLYVVADDLPSPVGAIEFGMVTSHPATVSNFMPNSPFLLNLGSGPSDVVVAAPAEVPGPTIVGYFDFIYLGEERVSFELVNNSQYGGLRWIAPSVNTYHDFAMASPAFLYSESYADVEPSTAPLEYRLYATSPNPFESSTTIRYDIPQADRVKLAVYDVNGRSVRSLVDLAVQEAGRHTAHWDGRDDGGRHMAPGIYFCRLETSRYSATQRVTLLK